MRTKLISLCLILFTFFPLTSFASTLDSVTSTGVSKSIGFNTVDTIYQGYIPGASHNICNVTINLAKSGSPSDSVSLSLYLGTSTLAFGFVPSGSLVQSTDASIQPSSTSFVPSTFTFTPCAVVVGANSYYFLLKRTGAVDSSNYFRADGSNSQGTRFGTGSFYFDYLTNGSSSHGNSSESINIILDGTENFSAFQASSTTSYSTNTCTPPSSILDVGGGVSYAFCIMFVPSQSVLNQFSSLGIFFSAKFPFSYISGLSDVVSSLSAGGSFSPVTYTPPVVFGHSATTTPSTILDLSSIASSSVASSSISYVRTYSGYALYLFFGMYAFKTIMALL